MTLPDFLIIGAMKCGTEAAAKNLALHPDVWLVDPAVKQALGDELEFPEVQFFNDETRWGRGVAWYRRFFEGGADAAHRGEKSAEYLSTLAAHPRMRDTLPRAKLIVLLRDPVARAFSHWRHLSQERRPAWDRFGLGGMPFDEAVRTALAVVRDGAPAPDLLWKGAYATQLEHLFRHFPREQVLVCIAERVRAHKRVGYARMLEFIGASRDADPGYRDWHVRAASPGEGPDAASAALLARFYEPHAERLFSLLGEEPPEWRERGCAPA